ncbi:MAG: putative quinol monooxygenase [Caulobacteraceae bacterium]
MSVLLAGTVRFAVDRLDVSRPRMIEMIRLSGAEDGCLAYTYAEDLSDPGLIHIFEVWRDEAALNAHHAAPHFVRWRDDREALGMSDRRMNRYDVSASRPA